MSEEDSSYFLKDMAEEDSGWFLQSRYEKFRVEGRKACIIVVENAPDIKACILCRGCWYLTANERHKKGCPLIADGLLLERDPMVCE